MSKIVQHDNTLTLDKSKSSSLHLVSLAGGEKKKNKKKKKQAAAATQTAVGVAAAGPKNPNVIGGRTFNRWVGGFKFNEVHRVAGPDISLDSLS